MNGDDSTFDSPMSWRSFWPAAAGVLALAGIAAIALVDAGYRNDRPADPPRQRAAASAPARAQDAEEEPELAEGRGITVQTTRLYDAEWPAIPYASAAPNEPVARLARAIERGDARLAFSPPRGYLDALLEALDIDPASQVLVFSQTSLQSRRIDPRRPRAIYFNDEVYVAWVQNGPLEIASVEPELGPVFYLLDQDGDAAPAFDRELDRCLSCHDSYSLSGGGVPRLILGSGYTGVGGNLVTHEGWILVSDRTPFRSRFGGWYVTGTHGDQRHLGNLLIRSYDDFERLDELRVSNVESLETFFDTTPYARGTSDIVALMVLQHQTNVQNAIVRVGYETRTALAAVRDGVSTPDEAQAAIAASVEPLVCMMLFCEEIELTAPLAGDPEFVAQFQSRAVRDAQGRSLRDFDMTRRMFRYPLSYLIHSRQFESLPDEAKTAVYRRLAAVLTGADRSEPFARLTDADRASIVEIVATTKPELAALLR